MALAAARRLLLLGGSPTKWGDGRGAWWIRKPGWGLPPSGRCRGWSGGSGGRVPRGTSLLGRTLLQSGSDVLTLAGSFVRDGGWCSTPILFLLAPLGFGGGLGLDLLLGLLEGMSGTGTGNTTGSTGWKPGQTSVRTPSDRVLSLVLESSSRSLSLLSG